MPPFGHQLTGFGVSFTYTDSRDVRQNKVKILLGKPVDKTIKE
jgi:hypothetical protein